MIPKPLERSAFEFGVWSYGTNLLTSFQGLVVACIYCFFNGDARSRSSSDKPVHNSHLQGLHHPPLHPQHLHHPPGVPCLAAQPVSTL
ncbi:PDF receptor [Portunus trituberculatus]|uniref:PDF receptor n=1 Tax=Portunus trituberculatus TaxID=210409 RepID=A0A5B7GIK6_PORTR|nr:PDF receptor [Portunus trituberculatus]